jgi:uncharacterized protein YhhL (DUF1145 family)
MGILMTEQEDIENSNQAYPVLCHAVDLVSIQMQYKKERNVVRNTLRYIIRVRLLLFSVFRFFSWKTNILHVSAGSSKK